MTRDLSLIVLAVVSVVCLSVLAWHGDVDPGVVVPALSGVAGMAVGRLSGATGERSS